MRCSRLLLRVGLGIVWGTGGALLPACSNDPYPDQDAGRKVLYRSFREAPRTLDPAVAYTTGSHAVSANIYDTLLEYHYLKRPYELIPGLAQHVPRPQALPEGGVAYRFELRPGVLYQDDPCFEQFGDGPTREVVAADFAFELARIADPAVNSPVTEPFSNLVGFREFSARLTGCGESDWVGRDASDGRRAEQGEGSPFPVRTGSVSHG